jgi:hypothetical protein
VGGWEGKTFINRLNNPQALEGAEKIKEHENWVGGRARWRQRAYAEHSFCTGYVVDTQRKPYELAAIQTPSYRSATDTILVYFPVLETQNITPSFWVRLLQ